MIDGHLRFLGHHIPCSRIQGSYARVHGAPSSGFGPRHIQHRVYNVAGPNSLWHHDGQHGEFFMLFIIPSISGLERHVLIEHGSSSNEDHLKKVLEEFENPDKCIAGMALDSQRP